MNLPHLCARCGSTEITSVWRLKGAVVTHDWGNITAALLFLFIQWTGPQTREKYDVPVPVCNRCLPPLRRARAICATLRIAGVLIGAGWLGIRTYEISYDDEFFGPLLWIGAAVVGALIGWAAALLLGLALNALTQTRLGSFNGRYFRFHNQDFEAQFGELNPGWAKPGTRKSCRPAAPRRC